MLNKVYALNNHVRLITRFYGIVSLSLVSDKLAFLHDGYIAAIKNCCASTAVKCTLFPMCVASLQLGALFNTIFATGFTSLLLGASFNTQLAIAIELYT